MDGSRSASTGAAVNSLGHSVTRGFATTSRPDHRTVGANDATRAASPRSAQSSSGHRIAGFPAAFITAFFTGSLLTEYIFSLDGLGRLGYDAVVKRDYPIVFATLYIFSLMGLLVGLLSDLIYTWVDPRIDFDRRDV